MTHAWADPQVGPLEDAAVVRPPGGPGLAFTVDFITPVVDDPTIFGRIAAVNAMSDVYAMGGEPRVALAVCGFPADDLPLDVLEAIFRGGRDAAREAGCMVVGGHTIQDAELKYGLCVVGELARDVVLDHTRVRAGDRLVLTKPLGIGIVAQGIKQDLVAPGEADEAIGLMTTLNAAAKDAALEAGAHAATDVTGFGLLGHVRHLLLGAGLAARVRAGAVPVLDSARRLAGTGVAPGGSRRNLAYVEPTTTWAAGIGDTDRLLLADAQTSGGLLIAVAPEKCVALVTALERRGTSCAVVIGDVVAGTAGHICVET